MSLPGFSFLSLGKWNGKGRYLFGTEQCVVGKSTCERAFRNIQYKGKSFFSKLLNTCMEENNVLTLNFFMSNTSTLLKFWRRFWFVVGARWTLTRDVVEGIWAGPEDWVGQFTPLSLRFCEN